MNGDMPRAAEGKTFDGESYELYDQFYEKEDCVKAAKDLREEGHKARTMKNRECDNSYLLYVHWDESNPFE